MRRLIGRTRGVDWEVTIRWTGGRWSELVGLKVGVHLQQTLENLGAWPAGRDIGLPPEVLVPPIAAGALAAIAAEADHVRADHDATQRVAMVWRDIEAGALARDTAPATLGGFDFHNVYPEADVARDVTLASNLYRLFSDLGSRAPTEDVAKALTVSRATAARRIKAARAAGILGPARMGAAGEFPQKRTGK